MGEPRVTKGTKKHDGHKEIAFREMMLRVLCVSFVAFVTFVPAAAGAVTGVQRRYELSPFDALEQAPHILERIGLLRGLVLAPAEHAWKADGDTGPMPGGSRDALETELEYVDRLHVAHRPEPLAGVTADPLVQIGDFLVRQSRVRLGDWHELAVVPDAERVIGEEARALAAARLRVDQDGIDGVRIDFPLPPITALASDAIGG